MTTQKVKKQERQYYVDWLRIFLILSVFLFHIGMLYNSWEWHVKSDVTCGYKSVLWYIMVFLGRWRMPLLILISGAGTFFALGKRSSGQYLGERFKRLFIPLLAGVFILVPVQVYVEKAAQYDSLIAYYPHMFEGVYPSGNFSWHHLWFIAYLFFIALLISPFLNFFRSDVFARFKHWLAGIVSMPLGANVFIIPLVISQAVLGPWFPENTHDLVNDWAAISHYLIFFLAGFILLSNNSMTASIRDQRHWFLVESLIATLIMFTLPYMVNSEKAGNLIWDAAEIFVAWSCGMTAIGYAKQYLNFNNNLRKLANEAIYPFYLLHQPVIVVMAYVILPWQLSIILEVLLITVSSLLITIGVYWFIIRPYNALRLIFGMKLLNNKVPRTVKSRLVPVLLRKSS